MPLLEKGGRKRKNLECSPLNLLCPFLEKSDSWQPVSCPGLWKAEFLVGISEPRSRRLKKACRLLDCLSTQNHDVRGGLN